MRGGSDVLAQHQLTVAYNDTRTVTGVLRYVPVDCPSYHERQYRVSWNGVTIGEVYRRRRNLHNKHGRIIYRTTSASKWFAEGHHRLERDSRREAALQLLAEHIR